MLRKDAAEVFGNFAGLDPLNLPKRTASIVELPTADPSDAELRRELRRIILEEINAVLAA